MFLPEFSPGSSIARSFIVEKVSSETRVADFLRESFELTKIERTSRRFYFES